MRLNLAISAGLIAILLCGALPLGETLAQSDALAPGVLKIIPSNPQARDSFSLPMRLPGLETAEWDPNYYPKKLTLHGQTQNVVLYRDVWQYELGILGLRQIRVRSTDADGESRERNVWYLVYRVRNLGNGLTYEQEQEDPRFEHVRYALKQDGKLSPKERSFLPRFTLEGWVVSGNQYEKVSYRDTTNPSLLRLIQQREDPELRLLDTFGMNNTEIPVTDSATGGGVWGVAIWENVDPRIDFVSVYVTGLTNAYRIENKPDGTLGIRRRTLQMNFWRPGDSVNEVTDQIRYGIPLVDDPAEQIEICRRYSLPGPIIKAYYQNQKAEQNVLIGEIDAQFDLDTLKSPMIPKLDAGELPPEVAAAMGNAGYSVPADATVATVIQGLKWSFEADGTTFVLELEPQFWEPKPTGGIRFIRSLDYLWIYR